MRIVVKTTNVQTETTNKGNVLYKQLAAIDRGDDFPLVFSVNVQQGQPYPVGEYDLDVNSFRNDPFGGLELDRYKVRLIPRKAVKAG